MKPKLDVVEDNDDNRLLLRGILEDLFELREFETGPDALRAIQAERPDIVLLDISLPGMDGVEVLVRLRENPTTRNLPVVALTAHAMVGDREKFLAFGFDDYVSKPIVDESDLFAAIRRCLARTPAP
ncbi:MAG TPA: response regulator [Elusimicrobiota bacterium]|nr:response regulator [Elusimicrobiota bacterium]HMU96177.1 response regulator [Elusimicrobiota bacterium]